MTNIKRATRSVSWVVHGILLALVVGYIVVSALRGTPDANIGSGLGLLALGVLGAPWTLPLLMSDDVTLDSGLFLAAATGGAAVNLVLHAVAIGLWHTRSRHGR